MAHPWWQSWLVPERPGLRQFALVATALLLPVAALLAGPAWMLPTMVVAATIGGGLGLGWAVTVGHGWLQRAPANTVGVLAVALASFTHLQVMPYWDLALRMQAVRADVRWWAAARGRLAHAPEPSYDRGPYSSTLQVTSVGGVLTALTPEPLQRWSPFGWRDAWYLLLRQQGDDIHVERFASAEAMQRAVRHVAR